jgi:5-methylcytosine-specific restriction endonuclease McrA
MPSSWGNAHLYAGKLCPYCTRVMVLDHPKLTPTRDHIKPRSKYWSLNARTIVVCIECNHLKADRTLTEFLKVIINDPNRFENVWYLIQIGLEQ